MPYTLWSRGRLLGKSDLGFRHPCPSCRAGEFIPTELGERLMAIFSSLGPALMALEEASDDAFMANPALYETGDWPPPSVRNTTAYADAMSLSDELDSLELELRDEDGVVVQTEDISLGDTDQLFESSLEEDDDLDLRDDDGLISEIRDTIEREVAIVSEPFADIEEEPWILPQERGRYRIFVALAGHDAAMSGDWDSASSP